VGSNPTPSVSLVERVQEIDCITVSYNKSADFKDVRRCPAKLTRGNIAGNVTGVKKAPPARGKSDRSDKSARVGSAKGAQKLVSSISRRSPRLEVADGEWLMFQDCPRDQVRHCLIYEFAREHPETKRWFEWLGAKLSENESIRVRELLAEYPGQVASAYPTCLFYTTSGALLIACRDYFPGRPWLDVPLKFRETLAKQFWRTTDRFTGEEMFIECGDPELLMVPLKSITSSESNVAGWTSGGSNYAVVIDWTQSDKRLIERFALWVRRNAPTSRRIEEQRGRVSGVNLLKQLASLRLTKNATILQAMRYTEDKLGNPLYASEQTWSKQRKKAANFLSEFAL
jgi:hypothetical protein